MLRSRSRTTTPYLYSSAKVISSTVDLDDLDLDEAGHSSDHAAAAFVETHPKRKTSNEGCTAITNTNCWSRCFRRPKFSKLKRALASVVLLGLFFGHRHLRIQPNSPPHEIINWNEKLLSEDPGFLTLNKTSEDRDTSNASQDTEHKALSHASQMSNSKPKPLRPALSPPGRQRYSTVTRDMLEKLDRATTPYPDTVFSASNQGDMIPEYTPQERVDATPKAKGSTKRRSRKFPKVLGFPESKKKAKPRPGSRTPAKSESTTANLKHQRVPPSTLLNGTESNLTAKCASPFVEHERFILPLAVPSAEQDLNFHSERDLRELLFLSKSLNRTLVLPNFQTPNNLCMGWKIDEASWAGETGWIKLDEFTEWLGKNDGRGMTSQLVSVGTSIPTSLQRRYSAINPSQNIDINAGILELQESEVVSSYVYNNCASSSSLVDPESTLFGCYKGLFPQLNLGLPPAYITVKHNARLLGQKVIDTFKGLATEPQHRDFLCDEGSNEMPREHLLGNSNDPQVLIVNWSVPDPIFLSNLPMDASTNNDLSRSAEIIKIAKKLAPPGPYLAVHWKLEGVPLWDKMRDVTFNLVNLGFVDQEINILEECAYSLVDVIGRLLREYSYGIHKDSDNDFDIITTPETPGIGTVWFTSDYPYPIARFVRSTSGRRSSPVSDSRANSQSGAKRAPIVKAKNGTFRSFSINHERAVDIVRSAFEGSGELGETSIIDVSRRVEDDEFGLGPSGESLNVLSREEKELLENPLVLEMVNEFMSINAQVFVSGSSKCSKKSSFTRRVVDSRAEVWKNGVRGRWNIVDTFG